MSKSFFQKAVERIERPFVSAREALFQRRFDRYPIPQAGQLFILGLPRSGTTLLYQYIVHRKNVAYFTSGAGDRPFDPCRTTWLEKQSNPPYRSDFESSYGRSFGPMSPHEAGTFWLRFFDIDAYEDTPAALNRDMRRLIRTIDCVQRVFDGAPFVNKNVKHMLRLPALAELFPNGHFLVIERNRQDVALSLLRARLRIHGDYGHWYSVRPDNFDRLAGLPPEAQVCEQLDRLEARLNEDLKGIGADRVHRIDYQTFCDSPDSVFALMPVFFSDVSDRNKGVERFDVAHSRPENPMEERLVKYLSRRPR